MDPSQALDMLNQVVKGIKLPYNEHVLLERSVDVLREAISGNANPEQAAAEIVEQDPVVLEDKPKTTKVTAKARRGGRRKE